MNRKFEGIASAPQVRLPLLRLFSPGIRAGNRDIPQGRPQIFAGATLLEQRAKSLSAIPAATAPCAMLFLIPDPFSVITDLMKLLVAIVVILLIAGSFYADYKWRRWMAARKTGRDRPDSASKP
jgi:hypothetical protein